LSELALTALLALALVAALVAAPLRGPALVPEVGRGAVGASALDRLGSPAWVSLVLSLLLAVSTAGALAVTVLGGLGATGCLLAAIGVLMAAASARLLSNRTLGLIGLGAGGLASALVITIQVAAGIGATGGPASLLQQVLAGPASSQYFALLLVCWATGAWVGWLAIRERAGAFACAVPLVVLVADLVNIPPVLESAPAWPVVGATVSGLALVGWVHQERQLVRWSKLGVPWSGTQPGRGLGIVVGLALAVSLLALIAPPLNRTNISERFFHSGPHISKTSPSAKIAAISGYSTAVVPGGPIRQVRDPVLSYRTSAPGGTVYLRGVALSDFSNGNWYPAPAGAVFLKDSRLLPFQDSATQGTVATELDRREVSLTVTYLGTGAQDVPDLLYPGSPLETPSLPAVYRVQGQTFGHSLLTVEDITTGAGLANSLPSSQTITTYGSISVATASELESAGTDYPAWVAADAALPPEAAFIDVNELAADATAMAAGATNPYQIAVNIQNALRSQEIYTLDPPPVPAGVWPIVYFLNDSHRGYCQYFASAMGAMLRTLGIPARLVSGFGPGEEGKLRNGARLITEADAHTWVQVYFPHYGWVNFEPTPDGFYQPTGAAASQTGPAPSSTALVPHPGVRSTGVNTGRVSPVRSRTHLRRDLGWVGLVLAILLIAAILVAALRWLAFVRTPRQLRRRLALAVRLGRMGDPRCLTVTELARGCARVAGTSNVSWEPMLMSLAITADRISFSGPQGPSGEGDLAEGWALVRRGYPSLLWRAWRAGRRPSRGASKPTVVRLQSI
jgi:transglutaminase-like putative cysteine protease